MIRKFTLCLSALIFMISVQEVLTGTIKAQSLSQSKPSEEKPMVSVSKDEAVTFFRWVMGLVDLGLEENKHLSIWTKDRISWMFKENQENRLTFELLMGDRISGNEQVVYGMFSGYVDGKANIEVNLSLLGVWFWDNYQLKTPVDRARRNDLAVMLSHEVTHLQHGSVILEATGPDLALRAEEEKRTWTITVLEDIRPLVRRAEKLNDHFVQANEALLACKGDPDCSVFADFIKGHTKK